MSMLVDITLRDLQDGTESVLERWLRQPGDPVRQHEPLLEINTDKAVVEIPSPASGVLREVLKKTNDPVAQGDVLGRIEVVDEGEPTPASSSGGRIGNPSYESAATMATSNPARTHDLSPAVRQLVKKHNLDVSQIHGTGRGGRITYEDVQHFLKHQPATAGERPPAGRLVPHSPLRRRIAQHMVDSLLRTAPHVTAVFEADLSTIVAHRQQQQAAFQQRGVKLTYTAYFVAAAVQAVRAVPEVNSRWHDDALEVFTDCNIGIATAVAGGLLVPVLHRAQDLDLFGIAARLQELTQKARAGKLTPADLRHGTLTITNHGVSGSLIATPIINQPQSAILGVGKMEKRLVVIEETGRDSIQIRPMAYVTLTIDHRALDGFQANQFLSRFLEALNHW